MYGRRRRRSRRRTARPLVRYYKKVLDFAPVANAAGRIDHVLVKGVDSITMGQTGPIDADVPTGSRITEIHVNFMASNIVGGSLFQYISMQYKLVLQTFIDPRVVGGNAQRNQVLYQDAYSIGINQNANRVFKFRIPPKFQRVKESMQWALVTNGTNTVTNAVQVIYKVEL